MTPSSTRYPVQRVEIGFAGRPPVRQIGRASGVSDVEIDGQIVRCLVTGSFQPLLEAASLLGAQGDLTASGYPLYTVFYGIDFFVVAYLIINSTFLPRVIGVLLAIDGLGYVFNSFATLLAPGFAAHLTPWIQLPILPAEGSLCLWMLLIGVNVERWKEQARAAIKAWSSPAELLA